jgi:hypothetical protein
LFAGASRWHQMTTRLKLKDITICAADSVNLDWTKRALKKSMEQCEFGDAILFTDATISGPFRTVKIENLSREGYQAFRLHPPAELLEAAHVLFVEWDGYVVDPRAWRQHFTDFDYIEAKWAHVSDGMNVGNSGFSLLSHKLLKVLAEQQLPFDGSVVDALICRKYRPLLERDYGIRFAPESIADEFSYEHEAPPAPTFGFHGMGSMWRYVEDSEMIKLFDSIHPHVFQSLHSLFLLYNYYRMQRVEPMRQLYAKIRPPFTPDILIDGLTRLVDKRSAESVIGACERHWLAPQAKVSSSRIARNEPCPCGSGQRYKHCHGRF